MLVFGETCSRPLAPAVNVSPFDRSSDSNVSPVMLIGALPLSKTATYKIVVGGSHIDNLGYQMGGWSISWQGASGNTTVGTTLLQAIQATVGPSVTIQNVGTQTKGNYTGDVGIVAIGETPYAEGRGDSSTLAVSGANAAQVTDIC